MHRFNRKLLLLALIILVHHCLMEASNAQLKVGFYSLTCPKAEAIVRSVVKSAIAFDPDFAPVLLRLHFHDCFVKGCDGSILVDNGPNSEKLAFAHQGVRGFNVIDRAKQQLEEACGGVVSCADIVALAARDAVLLSKGPPYQVPTGRRDGQVSDLSLADDMPDVDDSIQVLRSKFRRKGLTDRELVVLTSAHTIGTTACFFMTKRLYNYTGKSNFDPSINPRFLPTLRKTCPPNGNVNVRLPLDPVSSRVFDDQILRNIKNGTAVIASDAQLGKHKSTRLLVNSYVSHTRRFSSDFVNAIVKMGRIGVITHPQGEIRRNCSAFN